MQISDIHQQPAGMVVWQYQNVLNIGRTMHLSLFLQ